MTTIQISININKIAHQKKILEYTKNIYWKIFKTNYNLRIHLNVFIFPTKVNHIIFILR